MGGHLYSAGEQVPSFFILQDITSGTRVSFIVMHGREFPNLQLVLAMLAFGAGSGRAGYVTQEWRTQLKPGTVDILFSNRRIKLSP